MQYVILFLIMAAVFGICFLVDRLCRKIFPGDGRKAVRLPRRSVIFGILLTFFAFAVMLSFWQELSGYLRAGCFIVLAMGLFLLAQYFAFSIRYDAEGFTFRALGKKPYTAKYADILGQKALITRSGVNSSLYLKDGEVPIFSAQVGAQEFLKTAFAAWCEAKGIDPDTVENNPAYLVYFPET